MSKIFIMPWPSQARTSTLQFLFGLQCFLLLSTPYSTCVPWTWMSIFRRTGWMILGINSAIRSQILTSLRVNLKEFIYKALIVTRSRKRRTNKGTTDYLNSNWAITLSRTCLKLACRCIWISSRDRLLAGSRSCQLVSASLIVNWLQQHCCHKCSTK